MNTVRKPATKARKGVNPFTKEEVMFKAKPASTVVKVRPFVQGAEKYGGLSGLPVCLGHESP